MRGRTAVVDLDRVYGMLDSGPLMAMRLFRAGARRAAAALSDRRSQRRVEMDAGRRLSRIPAALNA